VRAFSLAPRREIYGVGKKYRLTKGRHDMSVATVTEISATSADGFEAAVNEGIARANKTLRNVESAWVKDMNVLIEDGNIKGYKVNLEVTFVLED
jgi:dodecin